MQLTEGVVQFRGKNLVFSTDGQAAIKEAVSIFASRSTPTRFKGVGAWLEQTCASSRTFDAPWQGMPIAQ